MCNNLRFSATETQLLDTDVQRPFYSVATIVLPPMVAPLNREGVAHRYQATVNRDRFNIRSPVTIVNSHKVSNTRHPCLVLQSL